jgi:BirA family biotin operon repressor/biotin-[acetyl-CoA-carboxylase] ligase
MQAQRLTMICSLAVCDAVSAAIGIRGTGAKAAPDASSGFATEAAGAIKVGVKWPNDVLVGGRKVCGILTELEVEDGHLCYAVVGIGINVNVDLQDAPPLMTPATSLSIEAGRPVSRLKVLTALLAGIERRYLALCEGLSFHQEWAERMATLGHRVEASGTVERWEGLAVGVDKDGALLVRTDSGSVRRVLAGDVTLRPAPDLAGSAG